MTAIATEQTVAAPRWIAPGGWRRAAVSFALGAAVGALVALVVPRDERSYARD